MVDCFSRYVWAVPSTATTSLSVIRAVKEWTSLLGTLPLHLYLDSGSSFMSGEFRTFVSDLGMSVVPAPAQSHSSVGKVENHEPSRPGCAEKDDKLTSGMGCSCTRLLKGSQQQVYRQSGVLPI